MEKYSTLYSGFLQDTSNYTATYFYSLLYQLHCLQDIYCYGGLLTKKSLGLPQDDDETGLR